MARHTTPSGLPFAGESAALGQASGRLTLVADSTFLISALSGDLEPTAPHGLFFQDTRVLSMFDLAVAGQQPEILATIPDGLHNATVVGRVSVDRQALLVFRRRSLIPALHELIELRSASVEAVEVDVRFLLGADFAELLDVKDGRVERGRRAPLEAASGAVRIRGADSVVTTVRFDTEFDLHADEVVMHAVVPGRGQWTAVVDVEAQIDGRQLSVRTHRDVSAGRDPVSRAELWARTRPLIVTDDHRLARAYEQSIRDLGSLRVHDDRYGENPVVAAGAPWFMTLFGRDSLITSWMTLPIDRSMALSTLHVLGRLQGTMIDEESEQQPGKILHEVRHRRSAFTAHGGGDVYYGSVDATPLFVALAGELARWGATPEELAPLMPHVDAALGWLDDWGDSDGDGYVEYARRNRRGLGNQGWKDSWDAISFADGRLAEPPIALAEVQGYLYAAYRARAELAELFDDPSTRDRWNARAAALRQRFDSDFWIDDRGWYAMALDGAKQQVDSLASNMGHLLWTGIVEPSRSPSVAELLLSVEMFSGWGIRTLARSMGRYDPLSYHNGSVWPHDTAIAAAGLLRYQHVDAAHTLIGALLDAAEHFDGHLPELFTGLGRADAGAPVDYPSSSVPQAWSAASPFLLVRALLGLEPDLTHTTIHLTPSLPAGVRQLDLDGVDCGPHRGAHIRAAGNLVGIDRLPDAIEVTNHRRSGRAW